MTPCPCGSPRPAGHALCAPCQAAEDARNMPPVAGPLGLAMTPTRQARPMQEAQVQMALSRLRARLPVVGAVLELDGRPGLWRVLAASLESVEVVGDDGYRSVSPRVGWKVACTGGGSGSTWDRVNEPVRAPSSPRRRTHHSPARERPTTGRRQVETGRRRQR